MDRISARSRAFFRIGRAELTKPESFAVKQGEMVGERWDTDFHHPDFSRLLERINALPETALISDIVAEPLTSGFAAGPDNRAQPGEEAVPQVRPTQILLEGEIDLSEAYGIRIEGISDRHYMQQGEVLFNNTNSTELVGKSAVFRESGPAVCSNHVTRLRLQEGVEPDYVEMVLNWLQQSGYFARLCTNFNYQAGVNTGTLAKVRIPFPSHSRREELVERMSSARSKRRSRLAKADALLAGVGNLILKELEIKTSPERHQRAFAIRKRDLDRLQLSPSHYAPELRFFLSNLAGHPTVSDSLGAYVDINPSVDMTGLDEEDTVGFIPMGAVSDGAVGDYTIAERPFGEVRKGYTPFSDGDILWAKITPCMQNGKSCIVEGLPNGVGFGSTEFHVLRVNDARVSKEFVKEFVSQQTLRQVATRVFTGSAGQQRVPAAFLSRLPFPELPEERQAEMVEKIIATRKEARRLSTEAEGDWEEAKRWFEDQLLEPNWP